MVKKIILVHTFCDIFLQSGILLHGFTGFSACNAPQKNIVIPKTWSYACSHPNLIPHKKNKTKADLIYIIDNIDSSHSVFICYIYVYLHVYVHTSITLRPYIPILGPLCHGL